MQLKFSDPQRKVDNKETVVGGVQPPDHSILFSEVINMDIAERLQELRKAAGYSQEQLAEILGLSRQAVSKWESAQGKPEIDNIVKLSLPFWCPAEYSPYLPDKFLAIVIC